MSEPGTPSGHAFISYVREDSHHVDKLQLRLAAAGIPVWRDTSDLWPGEDWRVMIRRAITDDALVFLACFSQMSVSRRKSYQNEELLLAVEELRRRHPGDLWLIPVRFDECEIPYYDLGGGRTLASTHCADLFGSRSGQSITRLVAAILWILGRESGAVAETWRAPGHGRSARAEGAIAGPDGKVLSFPRAAAVPEASELDERHSLLEAGGDGYGISATLIDATKNIQDSFRAVCRARNPGAVTQRRRREERFSEVIRSLQSGAEAT